MPQVPGSLAELVSLFAGCFTQPTFVPSARCWLVSSPGSASTRSLAVWWPVGLPAAGITVAGTASSPARAGRRTGSGLCCWI